MEPRETLVLNAAKEITIAWTENLAALYGLTPSFTCALGSPEQRDWALWNLNNSPLPLPEETPWGLITEIEQPHLTKGYMPLLWSTYQNSTPEHWHAVREKAKPYKMHALSAMELGYAACGVMPIQHSYSHVCSLTYTLAWVATPSGVWVANIPLRPKALDKVAKAPVEAIKMIPNPRAQIHKNALGNRTRPARFQTDQGTPFHGTVKPNWIPAAELKERLVLEEGGISHRVRPEAVSWAKALDALQKSADWRPSEELPLNKALNLLQECEVLDSAFLNKNEGNWDLPGNSPDWLKSEKPPWEN